MILARFEGAMERETFRSWNSVICGNQIMSHSCRAVLNWQHLAIDKAIATRLIAKETGHVFNWEH